jgi:hypothetical protein
MTESLIKLYNRELELTLRELDAYPTEESIWLVGGDIKNPAGNLFLHLAGNLLHNFGHVMGGTDYVRNRDAEFTLKNVPRAELRRQLEEAKAVVESTLKSMTPERYAEKYPTEVLGYPMTTEFFVIHLYGHLQWHLGQINYHRRLLG